MNKLFALLALACAPLSAGTYTSVGAGPYILMPNVGVGYTQEVDSGELDLNANLSFSRMTTITELKSSVRMDCGQYFVGPSIHLNYARNEYSKNATNAGFGVVFGKRFDDSFLELSLQDDLITSKGFDVIPNLKIRYGVEY